MSKEVTISDFIEGLLRDMYRRCAVLPAPPPYARYFRRSAGEQTRRLFLTTSTGTEIEARVHVLFHPDGRFALCGKRFDVLFADLALDPSLTAPDYDSEELYSAVFGVFDPPDDDKIDVLRPF